MLNFKTFKEQYLTTSDRGDVEIFKNPTPSEFRELISYRDVGVFVDNSGYVFMWRRDENLQYTFHVSILSFLDYDFFEAKSTASKSFLGNIMNQGSKVILIGSSYYSDDIFTKKVPILTNNKYFKSATAGYGVFLDE
jgi:hypothetical protein